MDKKLLEQLEEWHVDNEFEKIVKTIQGIPKKEWDEEHYQRLGSALNNLEQYKEALDILIEIEDTCKEKHRWHFKMGYAYFYLDEINEAFEQFQSALEYEENDEDTLTFMEECARLITVPIKDEPFCDRVEYCWNYFLEKEEKLRDLINQQIDADQIMDYANDILSKAFKDSYFELGYNGEKFELILSATGDPVLLFKLVYFKSKAPKEVDINWNILIGRQRSDENFGFRMYGKDIIMREVMMQVDVGENNDFGIVLYHPQIAELYKEDEDNAYNLAEVLLDQAVGEVVAIEYITNLTIEITPFDNAVPLSKLYEFIMHELPEEKKERWDDPSSICESYTVYEVKPEENEDPRFDIFVGSTCCPRVVNGYYNDNSYYESMFDEDGANLGFIFYSLEGVESPLDYRDAIIDEVTQDNDDTLFIGGATGTQYGYIDFISWDLSSTLDRFVRIFRAKSSLEVYYQRYRRDTNWVFLKNEKDKPGLLN